MTSTLAPDTLADAPLAIGGRSFRSRLMVGTGKYRSNGEMVRAIEASGAEIVTVAVRRVDLDRTKEEGILLSPEPGPILPARQHCRLLLRRRGGALCAAGARGRVQRLREARGHR